MGIIEVRMLLNHKETDPNVTRIAKEYVTMQEETIEKLKHFL